MKTHRLPASLQVAETDWITFPGGELEGKRPNVLCPACREKLRAAAAGGGTSHPAPRTPHRTSHPRTSAPPHQLLCFECYRATVQRERALKAAGELDTASEERFQFQLPLEPVNQSRLARLRAERATERVASQAGAGRYVDRRRHAQIEARHALQHIVATLRARNAPTPEQERVMDDATHAAELQLPEAWLPFVASR